MKVVYIISNIDKSLPFEWTLERLKESGKAELSVILLNHTTSATGEFFRACGIPVHRVPYRGRKDLPLAFWRVFRFLLKKKPRIVHCHLFDAGFIGVPAAKLAGVKKRIYTRHYAALHHKYYKKGVRWDKIINMFSTHIVAPSEVVRDVLIAKEKVAPSKISVIWHGFKIDYFEHVSRREGDKAPIIGVIARYIELKGIQYIIPAFKKLLQKYPDARLVLANTSGDYASYIRTQLEELPESSYEEVLFEEFPEKLYSRFDIFVHVPVDEDVEAFGQVYIEALAAGVPSVFTLAGVAKEFVRQQENALVVEFKNSDEIFVAVDCLLKDHKLAQKLIDTGKKDVKRLFQIDTMIDRLTELYGA